SGPQAVAEQARIARSEQGIKVREAKVALDMLDAQTNLQDAIRENTAQLEINSELLKNTPESKKKAQEIEKSRDQQRAISLIAQGKSKEEVLSTVGINFTNRSESMSEEEALKQQKFYDDAKRQVEIRNQTRDRAKAKVTEEEAKYTAITIKEQIDLGTARIQQEKTLIDAANSIRQAKLTVLDTERQIAGVTSENSIIEKARLEDISRQAVQANEILAIQQRIASVEEGYRNAQSEAQRLSYKQELEMLRGRTTMGEGGEIISQGGLLTLIKARQEQENINAERKKELELLNFKIEKIRQGFELEKSNTNLINARLEARLEIEKAQFTSRAELIGLDKEYIAQETYRLDLKRTELDINKQLSAAQAEFNEKEKIAQLEHFKI
ncbi:MAG: hypothetical protein EB124_12465, partial [Betaproteobacteria bacterium]|nr:hypothetical protein [Betaproteobacteria bacterium]